MADSRPLVQLGRKPAPPEASASLPASASASASACDCPDSECGSTKAEAAAPPAHLSSVPALVTREMAVAGMDCGACASKIETQVGRMAGVASARVNFGTARLKIDFDPGQVSLEQVMERVTALGYPASRVGAGADGAVVRTTLLIEELDCEEEVALIDHCLKGMPGVVDYTVELVSKEVIVRHDPARINAAGLIDALARLKLTARTAGAAVESSGRSRMHTRVATVAVGVVATALAASLEWMEASPVVARAAYAVAIVVAGAPLFQRAVRSISQRLLDMNVLMTTAVVGAILLGDWLEAATVTVLFAIAQLLEGQSIDRVRHAIQSLMSGAPREAVVRRAGGEVKVAVDEVRPGEVIVVRPGGLVPLDGEVVAGASTVNQAVITGESMPVARAEGDTVFAGSLNREGLLEVRVTHAASDTTFARILHSVEEAQASRAPSSQFIDRFAKIYTPAVLALAVLIALVPPLVLDGAFSAWFYRALVLLVIACPCALVISTPVSIVSGLAAAARAGVLIKGGVHLEALGRVKAVAFDKTGTLTRGVPRVMEVMPLRGDAAEVLRQAAAVEAASEHPLAAPVVEAAKAEGTPIPKVSGFRAVPGRGAQGRVEGRLVRVGSLGWLASEGIDLRELEPAARALLAAGHTAIGVADEAGPLGLIGLADTLREEAREIVESLQRRHGIDAVAMLTGDNRQAAQGLGEAVGVSEVRAELLPDDKVREVQALRARAGQVAMVGDGVNDAPALAAADLGIAMGAAGNDTALEVADVALMGDDLRRLPWAIGLGRRTLRVIRQNIAVSILVKALFLALAVPGLATLWMAIAADMGTSLLVIFNGLRLLNEKPSHPPTA